MARLGRLATYPFRVFLLLSKGVLVIAMLLLFALNVATVMLPGVFARVSGLVGSVTGLRTVKASQDARLADLETRNAAPAWVVVGGAAEEPAE